MGRDGTKLTSMSKRRNDILTRVHCSGQAVIWLNKLVKLHRHYKYTAK